MRRFPSDTPQHSGSARDDDMRASTKLAIGIGEIPEEFIAALAEPVNDAELAALDHLLED